MATKNSALAPTALPLGPLMIDVQGLRATPQECERLLNPLVGGVILFARNFSSKAQLIELTTQIHALRSPRLLIAVDHEGGRVQRFKEGFTRLPPMRRLGEFWMQDALAATRAATAVGYVLAAELLQAGVDFTFAPVLDLDYGGSSVIGDRSFHEDARVVAMLAKSVMHGMSLAGMKNCGKHFPGHGYVRADSHHEVPIDSRSFKAIQAADMAPYDWLGSPTLSAVMPAHVIYPKVDQHPAGFSTVWLQKILREQLKFDGVVISDDLSMEAAAVAGGPQDRVKAAISAGCDMVLLCNSPQSAAKVLAMKSLKVSADSSRRIAGLLPAQTTIDQTQLALNQAIVNALVPSSDQ
jgi:beta-N-acetylhexosaminidase